MTRITIALGQVSTSESKAENLERGIELIRASSKKGADLLILPELFMAHSPLSEKHADLTKVAERVHGPFTESLGAEARKRRLHVAVGIYEKSPEPGRVFNTVVMLGPDGRMIARHRKVQLFDSFGYKESSFFEPGQRVEGAFDTKLGRMGMMTCYELRFPEIARVLALQGAEIIVVPTAWFAGHVKEDHLHVLARARALENTVFVAVTSQTGRTYTGRSVIVDPFGVPICDAGEEECVATCEIDLDRVRRVRKLVPSLRDSKTELYRRQTPKGLK